VYDAIYCATRTLRELQETPGFFYLKGARVLTCRDDGAGATIMFREQKGGVGRTIHGQRAFIAAGALATTKIVVSSLGLENASLRLAFHPYFLMPMLMARNEVDASRQKLHTLAQLFFEIVDPAVSKHTVHLQLYTYSPLFSSRIDDLGALRTLVKPLLLGRLVALQGFLHSNEADPVRMEVTVDPTSSESRVMLSGALSGSAIRAIRRVRRKLAASAVLTGLAPISIANGIGAPGDGNHIGSVFPMSRTPQDLESDTLGRIGGMTRVHAVDASVLPSIPASTITFSAMANARRIAEAAIGLD